METKRLCSARTFGHALILLTLGCGGAATGVQGDPDASAPQSLTGEGSGAARQAAQTAMPTESDAAPVSLTADAAAAISEILSKNELPASTLLRVGVAEPEEGRTGYTYTLRFDDSVDKKSDVQLTSRGVSIVIDRRSLMYLEGTRIGYRSGADATGFTFDNPNAVQTCVE